MITEHTQEGSRDLEGRTVIGSIILKAETGPRDGEFDALWKHYEPKVRKTAMQYRIEGAVGAELDDLVQIGQELLLHALRKHDPAKSKFSTFYYTCLKNEFAHLHKRCFPKKQYMVVSFDPATGRREIIKVQSGKREVLNAETGKREIVRKERSNWAKMELEAVLVDLRSRGCTYSIYPVARNTRYPVLDGITSIDGPVPGTEHSDQTQFSEVLASPEEPLTVDEVIERIRHRIPDEQLRQIAIWLFEGHKMSGKDGIMRRSGLRKHQAERALHRIRMLLAGEFGLQLAPEGPIQ